MSSLPILTRELRLAARRPLTYRLRVVAAMVTSGFAVMMILSSGVPPAQLGQAMFKVLSGFALAYALLSGVVCTADSLSAEKREGTLGLLFLTNLRGCDVVLGKLAVASLRSAYVLLSILPILAIPVLLGAVTGSEFWRMNLLLLNALLFSLVTGLFVSAFGKSERGVMLTTLFVLICVNFGLPLFWKAATTLHDSRWWDVLLLFPCPAYAYRMVTDAGLRTASAEYRLSMAAICACSCTLLVLSCWLLPHLYKERALQPAHRWQTRLRRWRFGPPETRRFIGARLLEQRPFLWLLSRERLEGLWMALLVFTAVGFAIWLPSAFNPQRSPATPIAIIGAFAFHLLFKLLAAADAYHVMSRGDRREPIFRDDQDRKCFLETLGKSVPRPMGKCMPFA